MAKPFKKVIYLFFALILFSGQARATHIVGGDLTYDYLGGNNYRIYLYLYVDCFFGDQGAIDTDVNSQIGVFNSSGTLLQSLSISKQGPTRIEAKNYSCVVPPSDQCVDLFVYTASATLMDIPGGYTLVFQRCCRNGSIINIMNPGATGSTYRTFIPQRSNVGTNSSPRFSGTPPNFLCTNEPLVYDHSAIDPDGDSLSYELFRPLHGASQTDPQPTPNEFTPQVGVTWRNPYNNTNQVASTPGMVIHPNTGLLEVTPTTTGQFVVGIAVHEYRNGVRINTVFRDFQFNIYNCNFTVKSVFAPIKAYCSNSVTFSNSSSGNPARYKWDFGIDSREDDTSNAFSPTFVFPGPGIYTVRLYAYSSTGCANSSTKVVHILEDKFDGLIQDSIACYMAKIQLGPENTEPGINYVWTPATGLDNAFVSNPVATITADRTYTVRKSSVSCHVETAVNVFKNTIDAEFVHEYLPPCDGLRVKFHAIGTNYTDLFWDFGDATTDRDFSYDTSSTWFYTDSGIVYVNLWMENEHCKDSIVKPIRIIFPEIFTAVIDTSICLGDRIVIGPLNDTSILSFSWSTSEYMSDDEVLYPVIEPEKSIAYVLLKTYAHCQQKDSFNVRVNELPDLSIMRSFPGRICADDSVLLSATGEYSFEWFPKTGLTTPYEALTYAQPDSSRWYFLRATTGANCTDFDSVFLELYPQWEVNLDPIYVACRDEVFLPDLSIPEAEITWRETGADVFIDSIRKEGFYIVNARTQCQDLFDTFQFAYYQESYCLVNFPNAFTPNGDGLNDSYPYSGDFRNIFGVECTFDSYQLILFNRWGEIVFRSNDPTEEWDGTYKNNGGIQEVFGYYLTYKEFDWCRGGYVVKVKKGNFTALH
ncbi:MAG TPA: hypothetical protein DIW47_03970 [Bacteroidetes bacterium]|nr:hypothetical protein [Bacteroidota bacterium]